MSRLHGGDGERGSSIPLVPDWFIVVWFTGANRPVVLNNIHGMKIYTN